MGALEEDVELERAVTKTGLADGNTTAEMKEGGADGGRIQMTTQSTARTNEPMLVEVRMESEFQPPVVELGELELMRHRDWATP